MSSSSVAVRRFSWRRSATVKWETPRVGDPRLDSIIEGLEATGWAAEVCDADWRLVWLSSQARALIGDEDSDFGLGQHILESRKLPAWRRVVPLDAQRQWLRLNA